MVRSLRVRLVRVSSPAVPVRVGVLVLAVVKSSSVMLLAVVFWRINKYSPVAVILIKV